MGPAGGATAPAATSGGSRPLPGVEPPLEAALATPNFLIQEQSMGIHYHGGTELLDCLVDPAPFRIVAGDVPRLAGPGLGISVDEVAVRRADRTGHAWRHPVRRHDDGSSTEW